MIPLAHSGGGYGWGGPIQPWELHPAIVHLPIAFLLGGVALDLYAWWRGRPALAQVATGLLVAGVLAGAVAILTGILAYFTVPAHTEEAHGLMYWHLGIQAAAWLLFAWPTWVRWREWTTPPAPSARLVPCLAAVLMILGSGIGGYIVYHGGAGVDPVLLTPELRRGHDHHDHDHHDHEGDQPKDPHRDPPTNPLPR